MHNLKSFTGKDQFDVNWIINPTDDETKQFLTDQLVPRLNKLLENTTLPPSDVAVLDNNDVNLIRSILQQHNIQVQTIEEQLINRCTDKVIVDEAENVASSEFPFVFSSGGNAWLYNLFSRARTSLTIFTWDANKQSVAYNKFPSCTIHHY